MAFLPVQGYLIGKVVYSAVHTDPDEAGLPQFPQLFLELPLFPGDDRRKETDLRPLRQGQNIVRHHFDGLGFDLPAASITMRDADSGIEEPQVIVNLGHRSDRGAGVLARLALLYGDGRRQTFNGFDLRLVHPADELPGIGGERFHVPPLAFGKNGVEGQGGLARPAHAGDDYKLVSWDVEVDVFEVVLRSAPDFDKLHLVISEPDFHE